MKMLRYIIIIYLAISLCATVSNAAASHSEEQSISSDEPAGSTDRQIELIQRVLAKDGELTPQMHSQYWADFKDVSKGDSERITKDVLNYASATQQYQRALWQSAQLSLTTSKVIRSKELDSTWSLIVRLFPEQKDKAEKQAQEFLEAAASGSPIKNGDQEIYITKELTDSVIASIEQSLKRFANLLNPNWSPSVEL